MSSSRDSRRLSTRRRSRRRRRTGSWTGFRRATSRSGTASTATRSSPLLLPIRPARFAGRPTSPIAGRRISFIADQPRPNLVVDGDLLPLTTLFGAHARVAPSRHRAQLSLELAVALQARGVQLTPVDRGIDRAAGLAAMLAIVEAALTRNLLDIFEQVLESLVALPQLRFAQPRRVDDHPAPGKLYELAVARHMAPFAGAMNGARLHHLGARHAVDERRLARA